MSILFFLTASILWGLLFFSKERKKEGSKGKKKIKRKEGGREGRKEEKGKKERKEGEEKVEERGRKERADHTRRILRFDKVQVSRGVEEPCLTRSACCRSYEEQ